jgi:hypothetical protein
MTTQQFREEFPGILPEDQTIVKIDDSEIYAGQSDVMMTNVGESDYSTKKIQPWDIIDEYNLDFYEGNVLKYLLRTKGSRREDLEKIRHYIDKMLHDIKE